jgi:hypothetical protein
MRGWSSGIPTKGKKAWSSTRLLLHASNKPPTINVMAFKKILANSEDY